MTPPPAATMMSVKALLTTSAVLLQLLLAASAPVDPPTCKVLWLFNVPCTEPASALVSQVKAWSSKKCRDSQEKCMYELMIKSPAWIGILHTSPSTHKITEIDFEFIPPAATSFCKIKATTTPKFDNGTSPNDYCLLYNLVYGSGLTEMEGYMEISNNAMCPPMQSAECIIEQ